jgi:quercetin dioxygenase-like cupin family protein
VAEPLEYVDYRTDLKNFLVTPEMRSRFMRLEPGRDYTGHTHDLGHEIFLVMEGTIDFDVAGRKARLGPGQACVALVDETHCLRVVGDQPATIYLSVTPHVAPTHTWWNADGTKKPPRYDTVADGWEPQPATHEMVDEQLARVRALASAADAALRVHERAAEELKRAIAAGDREAARTAIDAMWAEIYPTFRAAFAMAQTWNSLAPRATTEH